MGKRGPKPKKKVKIKWSPEFAYAIGLLATDGNLSPDGRHISFTSKDKDLVELLIKCLTLKNRIGRKARGSSDNKKYYVVQFGDVNFYRFLLEIGLMPKKSKIIRNIEIPDKYFFDFLRGHFDGDGTFYSYWDPRWRSSFMFYFYFYSASHSHIQWLQKAIADKVGILGHFSKAKSHSIYSLRYAKKESLKLLRKIYYSDSVVCLERKRLKIRRALATIDVPL